jgi:hypothetical protein
MTRSVSSERLLIKTSTVWPLKSKDGMLRQPLMCPPAKSSSLTSKMTILRRWSAFFNNSLTASGWMNEMSDDISRSKTGKPASSLVHFYVTIYNLKRKAKCHSRVGNEPAQCHISTCRPNQAPFLLAAVPTDFFLAGKSLQLNCNRIGSTVPASPNLTRSPPSR